MDSYKAKDKYIKKDKSTGKEIITETIKPGM